MVIRKVIRHGACGGITLPAAFMYATGLRIGDIVSIELLEKDTFIIRKVDLKQLADKRKKNARR